MLSVCWSFARHIVREHSLWSLFDPTAGWRCYVTRCVTDRFLGLVWGLNIQTPFVPTLFFVLLLSVRAVGSLTAAGVWFRWMAAIFSTTIFCELWQLTSSITVLGALSLFVSAYQDTMYKVKRCTLLFSGLVREHLKIHAQTERQLTWYLSVSNMLPPDSSRYRGRTCIYIYYPSPYDRNQALSVS